MKKVGEHEGPIKTSTSADYMKPYASQYDDTDDDDDENEDDDANNDDDEGEKMIE